MPIILQISQYALAKITGLQILLIALLSSLALVRETKMPKLRASK